MKKILLIDGNSLFYRSFYANQYSNLNANGIPTNGIYTFSNMLLNFLEENDYYDVKIAFDKGKNTFRHKMYDQYKAGRSRTPESLIAQLPVVREFVDATGIGYVELDEYEADDIVGTFAIKAKQNGYEVHILSSDKDLWQLVDDQIFVFSPISGVKEYSIVDAKYIHEKWGIEPFQITDLKGIMGDSSDNIKGVPGIGEVGAKNLLIKYGTLENIYENIENITGVVQKKLIDGKESAFFSKKLAVIKTDIDLEAIFVKKEIDKKGLEIFFEKYKMNSLIKKFCNKGETRKINFNFELVKSFDDVEFSSTNYIYFEILNENYHNPQIIGIGFDNGNKTYFVTNESEELNIFNWNENNISNKLQEKLTDGFTLFETYDIKRTAFCLQQLGYNFNYKQFIFDTKTAFYTLNPEAGGKPEKQLLLLPDADNIESDEDVFGKGVKRTSGIDENIKRSYIAKKTNELCKATKHIKKMLEDSKQILLFEKIDMPLNFVLFDMENSGVSINERELKTQTENVLEMIQKIEDEIFNLIENPKYKDINLMSPKQLKELLYDELKLPDLKKGSTDKEALDEIQNLHPIIPLLIQHRKLFKLYSTYLKGFNKYIINGKVHSKFNQNLTATGRLSSSDPNLQNISIRDDIQKQVRKIFVTSSNDNVFLGFDYSQIELRVLAQMANEKSMLEMFNNDKDIHEFAARKIFKISNNEIVTSDMRRVAKVFNFGIIYGLSDYGLSRDLKIPVLEAKKFITSYYETFPDLLDFKKTLINRAKENGFAETLANRRRPVPQLQDNNFNIRSFGERIAINMPIQGTASDIIKIAMINIYNDFKNENLKAKIIAQIHDELIIEVNKSDIEMAKKIVYLNMQNSLNDLLNVINKQNEAIVKLELSFSSGQNWYELK